MNDSPRPEEQATLPPSTPPTDQPTLPPPSPASDVTLAPQEGQPVSTDARAPAGYVIERELGRGGMGVVYKARSIALQRDCALKMILSGVHSGDAEIERFRTEAQAIARLQHPGIVQVFEIGEHDGKPFMALEFCGGGSLDGVLAKNPLKPRDAAMLVKTLAEAMHAAHQANVIHRDLKPANVLLASPGRESGGSLLPKITDFGLAKKLDETGATRTGSVMGTPSYMPPEQAEGKKDIGPAADIYALGAILYECLASRPPFRAATAFDTIIQVLTEEPAPLRQLNHQTPVDLETISAKCLQKEPGKRYATAQELADDLGRYFNGEPIRARPVGALERAVKWVRRHKTVSALAALVVLVLTAGVVVSWGFAYQAGEEAKAALKAEGEAKVREKAETAAKKQAEEQRDRAERLFYASKLSLAQSAFAEGNGALAMQHLDECQWNLRGWEHHYLWTRFNSKQTLRGHTLHVNSVGFSPDGRYIVSGGGDNAVILWDSQTGHKLLSLQGHVGSVRSVAFSPNGKHILTGSEDKTIKIWDITTGNNLLTLKGHTNAITRVAWSPDGGCIATGSYDKTIKVWSAQTGKEIWNLSGCKTLITSLAFNNDGTLLVSGGPEPLIRIWDVIKGKEIKSLTLDRQLHISDVCFSPDGLSILSGGSDHSITIWDVQSGNKRTSFLAHSGVYTGIPGPVTCVSYSPDGRTFFSCGGRTLRVWDARTLKELTVLSGHRELIQTAAFSPDGKRIVSGSAYPESVLKIWDAANWQQVVTLRGHTNLVGCVTFGAESNTIITGSFDKSIKLWNGDQRVECQSLKGHNDAVSSLSYCSARNELASGSGDNTIKIWSLEQSKSIVTLKGHKSSILSLDYSPDGLTIVSGSADRTVRIWDANKSKELIRINGHIDNVFSAVYSRDGRYILTGSLDKTAKLWNSQSGKEIHSFQGTSPVLSTAFSPDGKRILTGCWDNTAKLWDVQTGKALLTLKGHTEYVSDLLFTPDGRRIVTVSGDKTAKVWDATTGYDLLTLKGHARTVWCVSISRDGKHLATGSYDNTAKVWDGSKIQAVFPLKRHTQPATHLTFTADNKHLFTWDSQKQILAWSMITGQPVDPINPPPMPAPGPAHSPDGNLEARAVGNTIEVTDKRLVDPKANHWPLPDRVERQRYHTEQATLAKKDKHYFAVAFHLGRLLLDDPDNADLKRRREQALALHEKTVRENTPPRMDKVP